MKNLTFIFILLFTSVGFISIQAQDENKNNSTFNDFNFAAKVGVNYSKRNGDVNPSNSYSLDFHIGSVIQIPTPLNFSIQAEPQISRVGDRVDGEVTTRYTFFDIPILAQVHTTDNWSFEVGPKFSIILDERQGGPSTDGLKKTDRVKTLTPGAVAGTTFNINNNWFAQFRANYWFSDIIRKDAGDTEGTSILLFQFSIGYWFK